MFQERDYLFHSPKNQLMFQEIDYLFHFSEKPAGVSRDRLFIPFPKNQLIFREIHYIISPPENQLMFQERLAVLFQNRS